MTPAIARQRLAVVERELASALDEGRLREAKSWSIAVEVMRSLAGRHDPSAPHVATPCAKSA